MRGERTIDGVPFRYGGYKHNYDRTWEDWVKAGVFGERCWCCGGKILSTKMRKQYPYVALYKITKGKDKGYFRFRVLCRMCAYDYELGVTEMDGNVYQNYYDFNEYKYKSMIKYHYEKM